MRRFKLLFTLLCLFHFHSISNAQAPLWEWAASLGGPSIDNGWSLTTDLQGNIYVTGNFIGPSDFDPGPGVYNLTSQQRDIFLCKLNSNGELLWAHNFGSTSNSEYGASVTTDANQNVYITGMFDDYADFDPGPGTNPLTGNFDPFIVKLDSAGSFIWARQFETFNNAPDIGIFIATDASGNVYTIGFFNGTVDFDPGTGIYLLSTPGSWPNTFISKLDNAGNFIWARQLNCTPNQGGEKTAIVDSSGNITITGDFMGTVDFDPGPAISNLTSMVFRDAFVLRIDSAGNFNWVKQLSGNYSESGFAVAADPSGNLYVTGAFEDTIDIDPGIAVHNLISEGGKDIFIAKLDANGEFIRGIRIGNTYHDSGFTIATDPNSNFSLAGYFFDTLDFDPGPGVYNLTTSGIWNFYIASYDSSGIFRYAKSLEATSLMHHIGVTCDAFGNSYLMSSYNLDSLAFDNHTIVKSGTGLYDTFVAKLPSFTSGIEIPEADNEIFVYPNPVLSELIIKANAGLNGIYKIFDVYGNNVYVSDKKVFSGNAEIKINFNSYAKGIYFFEFITADKTCVFKIVKM